MLNHINHFTLFQTFASTDSPMLTDTSKVSAHTSLLSPQSVWYTKTIASIIAHIGVVICLVVIFTTDSTRLSICMGLILSALYIVVLVEAALCDTRTYLRHFTDSLSAEGYVERVRDARPMIRWIGLCYHYEEENYNGK